ncbi:MAG TPA: hypothetical protein VI583_12850, partial [Cyclobacteriaceae bacterium]|nr:hypothetical protein [Cyclobacteriaceae bacterium]
MEKSGSKEHIRSLIESAWNDKKLLVQEETQRAINAVIEQLDQGILRVAEPTGTNWQVNEWIKKAVILYFPIREMEVIETGPFEFHDKMKLK